MTTTKNSAYALSLLLISGAITCMELVPKTIKATLLIDHEINKEKGYLTQARIEYFNQENRRTYPCTKTLEKAPLATPFVKIIIINDETRENIRTIFPATRLINCGERSVVHFKTPDTIYHLTCAKNDNLIIKPKYFPQDADGNPRKEKTFETQFLSCMNQFYSKISCVHNNPNEKELIQNNILLITKKSTIDIPFGLPMQVAPGIMATLVISLPKTTYTHGPKGCSTQEHLVKLTTNSKTRSTGYSVFNHVLHRQQGLPKIQTKTVSTEQSSRNTCYYSYLENVKNVGNKSSMVTTVHSSKSPSLDIPNSTPMIAEEKPEILLLNSILEDCLIEFAAQEAENNRAPQNRNDLIGNKCILF